MIQCLNPICLKQNLDHHKFCIHCRTQLWLGDRYCATKYIGEGSFGRTFLAVDKHRLDSFCVIKQFLQLPQGKAFDLFKQEAQLLMKLGSHPQIPDLLAFIEQENHFYLIQQYIAGNDLKKILLQRQSFSEIETTSFLLKLLPVLQYIHSHQVIHRDIKLENIILKKSSVNTSPLSNNGGKYQLVLIDFGISKQLSQTIMTKMGTTAGTPEYAPPEQMRGLVNATSDLYSLAVCAIRMLTGCIPEIKNGTTVDEIYDNEENEWIWEDILDKKGIKISDHLRAILNRMLEDKRKRRFQSSTEVLEALQNAHPLRSTPPQINTSSISFQPVVNNQNISKTIKMPVLQSFTFDTVKVNNIGQIIKQERKISQYYQEMIKNNILLDMVYIPGGTFMMGTNECNNAKPIHKVKVPPFFMGKYAITQGQYTALMGENPSYFQKGDDYPVECVTWYKAQEFCQKLSNLTGKHYKLPSEAQWEYACRSNTDTPFYFGETITPEIVNYNGQYPYGKAPKGKYREKTVPVDYLPPNGFGLYNMYGNVWEWCEDDYAENYQATPNDGSSYILSFKGDNSKVLRGAAYYSDASYCLSASRDYVSPNDYLYYVGLRVVCLWISGL